MAENQAQERTEEATPKKRQDAKDKGQITRSRDLNTAIIMLLAGGGLWILSKGLYQDLSLIMTRAISLPQALMRQELTIIEILSMLSMQALYALMPFFLLMVLGVFIGPMIIGGWNFSLKALAPKASKLSPLKGVKRMFSLKSLVELGKAVGKFAIIASVSIFVLVSNAQQFLALASMPIIQAISEGLSLSAIGFLSVSAGLVIIAIIDVPFQIFEQNKQLKMTKQEVKDEHKNTEGKPEVKAQIRHAQRELANNRMMEKVPAADMILTNPTHYSVAIRYEDDGVRAPVVVAKGKDQVALRIRTIAKENKVSLVEVPALTRAVYFSTKLNHEIPQGLYLAIARVLAYVYQLKAKPQGNHTALLNLIQKQAIPEEYRTDGQEED